MNDVVEDLAEKCRPNFKDREAEASVTVHHEKRNTESKSMEEIL